MLFTIHSFLFIKSRFLTYILLIHIKKRGISMFVYNVKINGSKTFKVFFTGICILMVIISIIVCIRVFGGADKSSSVADGISKDTVFKISASNYTNVLKTVHDNIDTYVGKKVSFSGYIYRLLDFSDKQFVLARDMIISSDFKSVVVGFLCEAENAKDFENDTWVEITGEITKGDYHGDMPIVAVTEIKKVDKPNEEVVYPPDESYIPTSSGL